MFGLFKNKNASVPSGYPAYTAEDFARHFGVSAVISRQLAMDYIELLRFDKRGTFSSIVFSSGRNLHLMSQALGTRYEVDKPTAAGISRFLANIATAYDGQAKLRDLGVKKCTWVVSTCGGAPADPNKVHMELAGQHYDPAVGLETAGSYLLPGTAIGCTCISRPNLPI
jgi:hypothetical protein